MSVCGDSIIMRNGRTTSQVSIYNYPEHLNPFYEDDQHRRLRFWPINKKHDNERWKSISITSLKDLWPLKSFRLGKKRSSTLGINKTSESPPMLRRDQLDYNFGPPNYRNSMQNISTNKRPVNTNFDRNNQYRSTIQVMGNGGGDKFDTMPTIAKRYNYDRSYTPQPQRNHLLDTPVMNRRTLSHTSTTSTNPFESDDDTDIETHFIRTQNFSLTPAQRKKKRRAPIPTALLNKTNAENETLKTSQQNGNEQIELRINEEGDESIAQLATEIQNFVDTSINEDKKDTTTTATTTTTSVHESKKEIPKEKILVSTKPQVPQKTIIVSTKQEVPEETRKIYSKQEVPQETVIVSTKQEVPQETVIVSTKQEVPQETVIVSKKQEVPEIKIEPIPETQSQTKTTTKIITKVTNIEIIEKPKQQTQLKNNTLENHTIDNVEKSIKSPILQRKENNNIIKEDPVVELRVHEEENLERVTSRTPFILSMPPQLTHKVEDNMVVPPIKPNRSSITKRTAEFIQQEIKHKELTNERHENTKENLEIHEEHTVRVENVEPLPTLKIIENVELKPNDPPTHIIRNDIVGGESTGAIPRTRDWKDSTLAPLQTNVPIEKRKSAKEIIESINRQQRLLKEAAERNTQNINNNNARLKGIITYNHYLHNGNNSEPETNNDLEVSNIPAYKDPQKLDNGMPVFAKCRVYKEVYTQRESSPTASNLDWNPLPKPKRNKDMQFEY